jgi:RNA polymerase sigma factor (TIGR02999 family)
MSEPVQSGIPALSADQRKMLLEIAKAVHKRYPSLTLSPTAVMHEALLKVRAYSNLPQTNDPHFMNLMACVMRQVLVDAARKKYGNKNKGRKRQFVPLTDRMQREATLSLAEILDLSRALDELEKMNPRHALAVEFTSWFGYTAEEVAVKLEVSPRSVRRDLQAAHAWLASRLNADAEA